MAKKLDNPTISGLCRDMAMMIAAGITVEDAVAIVGDDAESGQIQELIGSILLELQNGGSFSYAAQKSGMFPQYAVNMMRIGEESGRLDDVLNNLSEYYDNMENIRIRIRSAVIYPAVMLLLMSGVLAVLVIWVMPVFVGVYENLAGTLTGSSYNYVSVAKVISIVSLALSAVFCIAIFAGVLCWSNDKIKARMIKFFLIFPLTKGAVKKICVSNFADAISLFIASGMREEKALEEARAMVFDDEMKATIEIISKEIAMGESFAQCVYKHKIFNQSYGRMLVSGSVAGNLEISMKELSKRCSADAQESLLNIIEIIEPVLTTVLTISVGLTLISIMLPLVGILGALG